MAMPLTAAPQGRRARRRAETRTRILRAAWGLFARQGFFATTVEQITEAADVGKGTFFNYFPSKEHVLAGFGEMQVGKIRAALEDYRRQPRPLREVLQRLVYALAEEPGRSPALVRSLLVANLSSEPVRQLWRRNLERGRRALAQLLAEGQRRGELRRDRKPLELCRHFQQTYFGVLVLWAIHPPSRLGERLEETFNLFWPGIEPRRRRESS
ncbi:MAG: hypothetical protein A3D93_03800 [Acidobacteria bacterium RIFCSPHIGHO2_12_FULL_67_30]|nr:MAG: hypothetical protein A3D93_03800 [Acidobacteria bacterium RIFCSPHIGHO2_12_FULL_67_30]